jgi:hypothetical protein
MLLDLLDSIFPYALALAQLRTGCSIYNGNVECTIVTLRWQRSGSRYPAEVEREVTKLSC